MVERILKQQRIWALAGVALTMTAAAGFISQLQAAPEALPASNLEAACQPDVVQSVAADLKTTTVTVQPIPNGPFRTATRFVAASDKTPAYCQVVGSFVTNPATGKTANFLATLPAAWNSKFLQLGCSGLCGQFYVSDPATPSITVTGQGYPGQMIGKGYATFSTDEGHVGMGNDWMVKPSGEADQDALDDVFYRADKVLARMGKEFAVAFYAQATGSPRRITRSYFSGCSGGGHDAFVAAAHFPEEYDGIIAGSPGNYVGLPYGLMAYNLASSRPGGKVSPALYALIDPIVKKQCDGLDGQHDGLIQNPAACNFRPERDLPRCVGDVPGTQCFTKTQIETISVQISGVTDEYGNVVQPGFAVSELQASAGTNALAEPMIRVFVHKNDPKFATSSIFTFREGGPGKVKGYHAVVPAAEVALARRELRLGTGEFAEDSANLIQLGRKFLIWNNSSDGTLHPYTSVNYYKTLARLHGGYANTQKNVRLFMLPGTDHCSITGVGPNSFDALGAMENWVERGQAPDALKAGVADHQFTPGAPKAAALKWPDWTMPLCRFPAMARYSGHGDVKDGANWSCPATDTRLLQLGESGRQAGVVE